MSPIARDEEARTKNGSRHEQTERDEGQDGIASSEFDENAANDISFLFDIPLEIQAELGRLKLTVKQILSLNVGSIIELDKLAGEPMEILVNDKMVCKGEVIVINEKYGIRMTDLISPDENLEVKKASQG
jgi:flagellar motor switch protein FliN/FliY